MKYLRRGTGFDFFRGHKQREKDVVMVLRDLIAGEPPRFLSCIIPLRGDEHLGSLELVVSDMVPESFQGPISSDEDGLPYCNNQFQLKNFVLNSKLLLNGRRAPSPKRNEPNEVEPMLAAVKLMCSHFLFEIDGTRHNVFAAEESQRVVYMASNAAPLYTGINHTTVNMDWMLHCMQFFRNHMVSEELSSLFPAMRDLSRREKPSSWREPLRKGSYPLSKHWKGTYSFLDIREVDKLRKLPADQVGDEYLCDKNVDEGKIQVCVLRKCA